MMKTVLVFLSFFGVYLHTAAPSLAPYRDAGEMACLVETMGVAHPPGYALYTLAGQLSRWIPFGNPAYRVNVFSALCGALALAVLFVFLKRFCGIVGALAGVLVLGFSNPFWELSAVSEMYALGAVFLVALTGWAITRPQLSLLAVFAWGLGLGVRMDLLLFGAVFALAWYRSFTPRILVLAGLFFLAGTSVTLCMLIRSHQQPWIDWGNPETLSGLLASLTRHSYSGRLDLLSMSYQTGENFSSNMVAWARHVASSTGIAGVGLALVGVGMFARAQPRAAWVVVLGLLIFGPLFLFLANMPLNPHAFAIVEASYLYPDCFIAILAGWGAAWLWTRPRQRWVLLAAVVFVALTARSGYARADKRENFLVRDYTVNFFRSAPWHAVVIAQKDVQLFSLWYAQMVEKKRPDVSVVPIGLSASPWYWEMRARWPVASTPAANLKEGNGWARLQQDVAPRPLFVAPDADLQVTSPWARFPSGTLAEVAPESRRGAAEREPVVAQLLLQRGYRSVQEPPDFFSVDLLTDLSRSYHLQGLTEMLEGQPQHADWFFERSSVLDPDFPRSWTDQGYLYFIQGKFPLAKAAYLVGAELYRKQSELAVAYRSLPEVMNGVLNDWALALAQAGVSAERSGDREEARRQYQASLMVHPTAQAHYNLAVTYWNQDNAQVRAHVAQALQLDPSMPEARQLAERMRARP